MLDCERLPLGRFVYVAVLLPRLFGCCAAAYALLLLHHCVPSALLLLHHYPTLCESLPPQDKLRATGGFQTFPSKLLQVVELLTTARVAERTLARASEGGAAPGPAGAGAPSAATEPSLAVGVVHPPPEVTLPPKEDAASVGKQNVQVGAACCWASAVRLLRACFTHDLSTVGCVCVSPSSAGCADGCHAAG